MFFLIEIIPILMILLIIGTVIFFALRKSKIDKKILYVPPDIDTLDVINEKQRNIRIANELKKQKEQNIKQSKDDLSTLNKEFSL